MTALSEPSAAQTPYTHTVRVICYGIGVAAIVFILLAVPAIRSQAPDLAPWYPIFALMVIPLLPMLLAMAALRLCDRSLRAIAGSIAVGYLLVLAAWMPAMTVDALPAGTSPWVLGYLAIPASAAALAWSAPVAWTYLGVASAALGLLRFAASGGTEILRAFQDTLYAAMFSVIFITLALALLGSSERLNQAARAARLETAAAAAADARVRQRARVDGLMHDSVFTTLLVAAESALPAPAPRDHARATLQQLDRLRAEEEATALFPAADFAAMQTATIRLIAPDASMTVQLDDGAAVRGDAALALGEALSEALRNSVRHAPDARRAITITASRPGIRLVIEDDGPGFDPKSVPANRLGIGISIIERMDSVPGGGAVVRSAPGRGTRVILQWEAQ